MASFTFSPTIDQSPLASLIFLPTNMHQVFKELNLLQYENAFIEAGYMTANGFLSCSGAIFFDTKNNTIDELTKEIKKYMRQRFAKKLTRYLFNLPPQSLVAPMAPEANNTTSSDPRAHQMPSTGETKEFSVCRKGALRVKPGLHSLRNGLKEAKEKQIHEIFLEDGVHDEKGDYVIVRYPVTIVGESKHGCTIIGGLKMKGKRENDVNVKHVTISQSKRHGV